MKYATVSFALSALASVASAAPISWDQVTGIGHVEGRALPTPVSAATARTYLASCKQLLYCSLTYTHLVILSDG